MSGKLLRGPWPARDAIDKIRAVNRLRCRENHDDYLGFLHRMSESADMAIERTLRVKERDRLDRHFPITRKEMPFPLEPGDFK